MCVLHHYLQIRVCDQLRGSPRSADSVRSWLISRTFGCPAQRPGASSAGKELFTREWLPGDKRSHAGAGLGPVFNARSCAACHSQGGVGGAGPKQTNITFVSAVLLQGTNEQLERDKLAKIHPALRTGRSFHLHRFGLDPEFGRWKAKLLLGNRFAEGRMRDEIVEANLLAPFATRVFDGRMNVGEAEIELHLSERNAPALFGLGLIERIPTES